MNQSLSLLGRNAAERPRVAERFTRPNALAAMASTKAPALVDLAPTWTDEKKKGEWYAGGIAYWERTAETNDGVLGGYGMVHDADISDSRKFIAPMLQPLPLLLPLLLRLRWLNCPAAA